MSQLTLEQRVVILERLVCVLAESILAHEYAKDLCRGNKEEALLALANENDLTKALTLLR